MVYDSFDNDQYDDYDQADPMAYLYYEREQQIAASTFRGSQTVDQVLRDAKSLIEAGGVGSFDAYAHDHNSYRIADGLEAIERVAPNEVYELAIGALSDAVTRTFELGRDPAELMHLAGRALHTAHAKLIRAAIVRHAHTYDADAHAPVAWCAQLDAIDDIWRADPDTPSARFLQRMGLSRFDWQTYLEIMRFLGGLGPVDPVGRIPSEWKFANASASGRNADDRILTKIRGLLAKAESSTYEPESDAFLEKAQALMTRYSIDSALLDAESNRSLGDDVMTRRLLLEYPYAKSKAYLLNAVCRANSVKSVWAQREGIATVIGMPLDLDLCEMLFTSLLVQAFQAITREGVRDNSNRTPSFRRSFLVSYADRIGERLAAVRDEAHQTVVAETGKDLVPIFAARSDAIESVFRMKFPKLKSMTTSISNLDGYVAGRVAADFADLTTGHDAVSGSKPVLH